MKYSKTGGVVKTEYAYALPDYNNYNLNFAETVTGFSIGFIAGFLAIYIMFDKAIISAVLAVGIGVAGILVYKNYLINKRKRVILLQFKDMLDSLNNSFSAGKNTMEAFCDAYIDLKMTYGEKAVLVYELMIIQRGLHNNFTIEDLLKDVSIRCGVDDINSFAETFAVCNRLGGNLKKIVSESKDIITDKIEIEMEIQTAIASNKNEINIMCIMPFVIISMMGLLGVDSLNSNTPLNIAVKLISAAMFITSYMLGRKIADIKV